MKNRIQELENLLQVNAEMYYNQGQSNLTDEEFDTLVKEYEELTNTTYKSEIAPPTGKKLVDVSHTFPDLVGTLDKAFDIDELGDWFKDTKITGESSKTLITPKYDGNSVILTFKADGTLHNALTRGKDGKGLDLTYFFRNIKCKAPEFLPIPVDGPDALLGVKCEALITMDNFRKIKELRGTEYANPRNLVAGLLNSLDGHELSEYVNLAVLDFNFYAYEITQTDENGEFIPMTKESKMKAIQDGSFKISQQLDNHIYYKTVNNDIVEIDKIYKEMITKRESLPEV